MFEKLVSTLLASRTQAHVFHLQSKSYSEHVALQAYYDGILELTDGLIESYQGKNGIISGYTGPSNFDDSNGDNVLTYFKGLSIFIEKAHSKFEESWIQNQIDTISELVYTTIYKLENLK